MKKIIILGTAGNCIDILDTINDINSIEKTYDCIGFLDDDINKQGKSIHGVSVIGRLDDAQKFNHCYFVNGIGSTNNFWFKKNIIDKTKIELNKFETIIHPTASVSKLSTLGNGDVILQNTTICSNVTIGNHVIILPNTVINHDTNIGDYTIIASGVCISGNVKIGKQSYLGTNSSIKNDITIGETSLVGMGSVVLKDVQNNQIVVGNPARILRETNSLL